MEAHGPVGREERIAKILEEEFSKKGLEVCKDTFGNVIAGEGAIAFGAHMDEIGLMVSYITEKGFLRFIRLGGIDPRVLPNQEVVLLGESGDLPAVIGMKPPHLMEKEEQEKVPKVQNLFIDAGFSSREEATKAGVKPGTPVSFSSRVFSRGDRWFGKAADDRVGCYVLTQLTDLEGVVLVGTTQEEVSWNGKGARVFARVKKPKVFIAVDVAIAGDHPEVKEEEAPVKIGGGPVITPLEAGGLGNVTPPWLLKKALETAEAVGIPYQLEILERGATDAASVHNVGPGIPSISISVPARYIHSSVSSFSIKDVEMTVKFLRAFAQELQSFAKT